MRKLSDRIANALDKMPQTMNKLKIVLGARAKKHFLLGFAKGGGQTDASLGGWKPLSTKYSERKRKDDKKRTILVDTGDMFGAIHNRINTEGFSVYVADLEYAEYHNEGTDKIPQREFIGESDELEEESLKRIQEEIDKLFI